MRSNYCENQINFGQVSYMFPQMQYNQVQVPVFGYPTMMAPLVTGYGQKLSQVVEKEGSNTKRGSIVTTEDFVSEGTNDSPVANTRPLSSFENVMANLPPSIAKKVSEFCTCEFYKNCTVVDDTTQFHVSSNDLSLELNKETTGCMSSYENVSALDANFLFPQERIERRGSKTLSSVSKNSL